jgi:hypothetical protein
LNFNHSFLRTANALCVLFKNPEVLF